MSARRLRNLLTAVIGLALIVPAPASAATVRNIAAQVGLADFQESWSANAGDFDKDGWLDIMLVLHVHGGRLYRNNRQGTFTLARTFPTTDRHDCAWGNPNGDTRPDMYCTLGGDKGTATDKRNELWIQQADGSFVDRAADYGVTDRYGRGRRTTFFDVDRDGDHDLYVGNAYPRQDGIASPNRFFRHNGATLVEAPQYGLTAEVGGNCVQDVDYDDDGWPDMLVCGQNGGANLTLYRNINGTSFADVSDSVGISGHSPSAFIADMNRDGRKDLVRMYPQSVKVQLQNASRRFDAPIKVKGFSSQGRELAVADADADGDLDIYALRGARGQDFLLLNRGAGTSFKSLAVPNPSSGAGDTVEPMDYDRDGRWEFFVMNGANGVLGPQQLIAFR
jgi:hypothetical protein